MRRDHFTVAVRETDSGTPTLDIRYDGPRETLTEQLTDQSRDVVTASEIDAAFRILDDLDDADPIGVFSLTHRITGEYLLEVNVDATAMLDLVTEARNAAEDDGEDETNYRIRIEREDAETIELDMDALLVYDNDGDLLRKKSLIPSGVEL